MGNDHEAKREHATPESLAECVLYLQRLMWAGQLRALAVTYVTPEGRDYCLYAVQHLDRTAAYGIGRGLKQLAAILAADSLGDLKS